MGAAAPLTKAIMDSWKPWELATVKLTALAEAIRENSKAAESTVDQIPSDSWSGAARSAANARAGDQHGWAKSVAARVEDLQTAITEAAAAIDSGREAVNGALLGASLQRFMLISENDPSWAMRYVPREDDDLTPGEIAAKEREMTSFIKSKADELATTAADQAALIKAAVDNVDTIAPPGLTLSAQDGRRHAHMAEDGWTDKEAASVGRSLSAAGLTDDQIRRLMNGEKLDDVPRGVQEYLHTFYGNLNENDLADLKMKLDAMDTSEGNGWSKNLGEGLITLSNENVGDNSGFQFLPKWVQEWASSENWNSSERMRLVDVPMAGLLGNSGSVPPGERFGTELIRRAASGASKDAEETGLFNGFVHEPATEDVATELRRTYENTLDQLLEVGARNHQASAAILSGTYADGSALEGYNRDETVRNVFKRDWDDGGETAGDLVKWIREYGGSGDSTKVALADRAFSGLFDLTTDSSDNFSSLMNANSSDDAIGKINPHVAGALREASLPYLNILTGADGEKFGHPGFDPEFPKHELQTRTARLFTVIASDNTYGMPTAEDPDGTGAGADLYRDILDQTMRNGQLAGQMLTTEPGYARSLAEWSANLRDLGAAGLYGAEYDLQVDAGLDADEGNAARTTARNIISSASAALTGVPHPAAVAVGAAGTAATPWILPPESAGDVDFRPPTAPSSSDSVVEEELQFAYGVLGGLKYPGPGMSPEWYQPDGQLKSLDQIMTESNKEPGVLLSDIENAIRTKSPRLAADIEAGKTTGSEQGEDSFDPVDRDNYTDIILNNE
ncbi:hypothetical protein FOV72_10710 [Gordonia rubripertincta]|uniref:TPR repeat region-containing protein n=1 Tax=Gordonia rubripertincta TaxID=36822 RepID=UPI00117CB741|nr:hypothetical protein [Gordonia rubripertincta]TSD96153.1 hypothetical protein FOV72_10710 [Gordonia rubripertincta]